jgi:hypothetical protein
VNPTKVEMGAYKEGDWTTSSQLPTLFLLIPKDDTILPLFVRWSMIWVLFSIHQWFIL